MTSNENVIDSGLTLYDINKMLIKDASPLDSNERLNLNKAIWNLTQKECNEFYMLLCNDVNYYTVFNVAKSGNYDNLEDVVMECAEDLGPIIAYSEAEGAIEIWVRAGEEVVVMYFFPYDRGVVKCL